MVILSTTYIVAIDHNSDNISIGMNTKVMSLSYCLRKTAHWNTKAILRISKTRTVVSSWKVFVAYIPSRWKSLIDIWYCVYCITVKHWFFQFITDDSIQGNEQEEGAIEGKALADNRSEIDSDCPEITNCSGKLSFIFITIFTLFNRQYYKIRMV